MYRFIYISEIFELLKAKNQLEKELAERDKAQRAANALEVDFSNRNDNSSNNSSNQ
jgi:hypothetical protein